jgi:hypothetical protein
MGKNLSIFISKAIHIIRLDLLLRARTILINKNNLNITKGHKIIILVGINYSSHY